MSIGPKTQTGRTVLSICVVFLVCLVVLFFSGGVSAVLGYLALIGVVALFVLIIYLVVRWIQNGE